MTRCLQLARLLKKSIRCWSEMSDHYLRVRKLWVFTFSMMKSIQIRKAEYPRGTALNWWYVEKGWRVIFGWLFYSLRFTYIFPCKHHLSYFQSQFLSIPISEIQWHWTRLPMSPDLSNRDNSSSYRMTMLNIILDGIDPNNERPYIR